MSLFKHQDEAIKFATNKNAALFMEPGLGKTLTSLELWRQSGIKKLYIVCPKTLIENAWHCDAKTFGYDLDNIEAINYEKMIRNEFECIKKAEGSMLVVDESTRIKNHKSKNFKVLFEMGKVSSSRIILSGTPTPNSFLDIWAQVTFLDPGILGKNFYSFKKSIVVMKRGNSIISIESLSSSVLSEMFKKGWKEVIREDIKELALNKIKPICFWRTKEQCLDMPKKINIYRYLDLYSVSKSHYENMRKNLVVEINGEKISAKQSLVKLCKLNQITGGFIYDNGKANWFSSQRIELLAGVLEEIGDKQAIIWCTHKCEIEMLSEKIGGVTLYSQTKNKDESINLFKNKQVQYLFAHPQSAAHGLTFTNCRYQVFYSYGYNYEFYEQARDRTHRISQTEDCIYYHLIARNTIDQIILDVLMRKKNEQDGYREIIA